MTNWIVVHSSSETRPSELDTTSSNFVVYERENIHQESRIDESSGIEITEWVYNERTMTKEEYESLSSPATRLLMQNLSDIEANILDILI